MQRAYVRMSARLVFSHSRDCARANETFTSRRPQKVRALLSISVQNEGPARRMQAFSSSSSSSILQMTIGSRADALPPLSSEDAKCIGGKRNCRLLAVCGCGTREHESTTPPALPLPSLQRASPRDSLPCHRVAVVSQVRLRAARWRSWT